MKTNDLVPKQTLSRRKAAWGVVVVLALLAGGAAAWWKTFGDPPAAWVVRWRIARYLKAETGKSDFKTDFKFPSKEAMAKSSGETGSQSGGPLRVGPRTKKDFSTLCVEYIELAKQAIVLSRELTAGQKELEEKQGQLTALEKNPGTTPAVHSTNSSAAPSRLTALRERVAALQRDLPARQGNLARKNEAMAPLLSDLWAFQRTWAAQEQVEEAMTANDVSAAWNRMAQDIRRKLNDAPSWAAMYELIGQELWVAQRLFENANLQHRRLAMTIALRACRDALSEAQNGWLAARICEGYVWPHLDVADGSNQRALLGLGNLVNECANVFRRSDEPANVIRTYRLLFTQASSPQAMDGARVQIAQAHEQAGEYTQALQYLKQVKATNDFQWAIRRIPRLEQLARIQR